MQQESDNCANGDAFDASGQKIAPLKQQNIDRMQQEPDNPADHRAIDANELKVPPHFEFDFLRDGSGIPMMNRFRNQPSNRVSLPRDDR